MMFCFEGDGGYSCFELLLREEGEDEGEDEGENEGDGEGECE